jgi:MFS transporter, FSR family, fosmidomycin resistance protein
MDKIEEAALPLEAPAQPQSETVEEEPFRTAEIITVAAAHGAHDTYFAYLPTILPLLIQNLGLNTTQAGLLSAFNQIPNLIQPVIGHLADHKNLKVLVILAPTLSGILVTLVGIAPNFGTAALLMLLAGFSTAGFHSIAPAMVSARAGKQVGRGMGFFMVGGEFGFGIGPLVVVATITALTLRGLPWLMSFGMLASVILYFRLKNVSTVTVRRTTEEASLPVRQAILEMRGLILPIMAVLFITGFLNANVVNYLPTFMAGEGVAFILAGASLSVVEMGAAVGVFFMGLYSDRLGQRNVALFGTLASVLFSGGFLLVDGWLRIVMLIGIGLTGFVANPAFLAMVQGHFTKNRSLANGVYMSCSFILRSIVVVLVGALADRFGMRAVFAGSAIAALAAVPVILKLPKK